MIARSKSNQKYSDVEYYKKKGWPDDKLPLIKSYRDKGELYTIVYEILASFPIAMVDSRIKNLGKLLESLDGTVHSMLTIYTSDDLIHIIPTSIGFFVFTEATDINTICPDIKCVDDFLGNRRIQIIESDHYFKNGDHEDKYIYDYRFPFDYEIDNQDYSENEFFDYLEQLREETRRQMSEYTLPELANIMREYVGESKDVLEGKRKEIEEWKMKAKDQ